MTDFCRQCKYLQLEKPSSIDFEMPIQKRLANNILEGWAKRNPPPGSDRGKSLSTAMDPLDIFIDSQLSVKV